jgi:ABC-2 type transport system ATP-binding protein
MSEPILEIKKLTKRFGNFIAAEDVTFNVAKGEIFGFLGANGAGKTTVMRMLCGLSMPSSGNAKVAGFDIYSQTEQIKKNIGYMSQKFCLYEDLTIKENIRLYGGIYGLASSVIKERSNKLLQSLYLTSNADKMVQGLPLGWKQKLAFSIAIFHEPKIVFLDEPTGGVDPITRRQFWEMIYETAEKGIAVFVTTHYMDEAEYCNRVAIMVDGKVEALDSPSVLKQTYQQKTMDDVFYELARKAKRESD